MGDAEKPPFSADLSNFARQAESGSGFIRVSGSWTMEALARFLQFPLHSPVLDETELGGNYRVNLQIRITGPASLAQTFREELGLDLLEEYRSVEVLVVDSARQPDSAGSRFPCHSEGFIQEALSQLPQFDNLALNYEKRMRPRRQLMELYPANVFVGMQVQDVLVRRPYLKNEWDWALAQYREFGDLILSPFLTARLIGKTEPVRAEELLRSALSRDPTFAWANLTLASILLNQGRTEEGAEALRRFRHACPDSLADAPLYARLSGPILLEAREALESNLSRRVDEESIAAYPGVWRLRRHTWDSSPEAFAQSVRTDLLRIRILDRTTSPIWLNTVIDGYELIGDPASLRPILDRIVREQPSSQPAYGILREREHNAVQQTGVPRDQGRWAHLPQVVFDRWNASRSSSDAATFVETARHYPDVFFEDPPPAQAAEVMEKAGIRGPALMDLWREAIARVEAEEFYRLRSDIPEVRHSAERRIAVLKARATRSSQ